MLSCVLKKAGNNALKQQKDFDGDRKLVVDPSSRVACLAPAALHRLVVDRSNLHNENVHHVSARAFQSITNRMICPCTYSSSQKGPTPSLHSCRVKGSDVHPRQHRWAEHWLER